MTAPTNGRHISTHEAVVKTAAVSIKTLAVADKQVTLAVFRQMDSERLVDEQTARLNGVPWGRVNYHPDRCDGADEQKHLHVVWQKGGELRRARVDEEWPLQYAAEDRREGHRGQWAEPLFDLLLLADLVEHGDLSRWGVDLSRTGHRIAWSSESGVRFERVAGSAIGGPGAPWAAESISSWLYWQYQASCGTPTSEEVLAGNRKDLASALTKLARQLEFPESQPPYGLVLRRLENVCTKLTSMYDNDVLVYSKWGEQYAALAALDLLFIAV